MRPALCFYQPMTQNAAFMDLRGYGQLLIFGGSFDPPHRGHVQLPRLAGQRIGADVVVYVPAGVSPFKQDQVQSSADHRLAMTRLAVEDDPHCIVLPVEIARGPAQPSYTVRTLEWLRSRIDSTASMRLLIGTDQALTFEHWREPQRIIDLAEPIVMLRPPEDRASFLDQIEDPVQRQTWANRIVELPAMSISATQIRRRVAAGASIVDLVPESVAQYIHEHRLYCS